MARSLMCSLICVVLTLFLAADGRLLDKQELLEIKDEGDISLGRLPLELKPVSYNLELRPDIYTGAPPFLFDGSVDIRFECFGPTDVVFLNSAGLEIDGGSMTLVTAPDSPQPDLDPVISSWQLDPRLQFLMVNLTENLVVGAHYIISMNFNSTMKTPSQSFALYWQTYESILDGQTKYFAVTLMWASSARRVFPCFDEPQMKASFNVTLLRKAGMVALSNADALREEDRGNGWTAVVFDSTMPMATYVLCFVVGDFVYMESFSSRNTRVRVWARPDYYEDLVFANSIAADIQEFHESWTGISEYLPKMDHIAIPGFGGAMENWGLVTYQESLLLYNATYNDLANEYDVAAVIAHELAHMWFGNLVTCRWWNDAWLNEGFATFFEVLPLTDVLGIDSDESMLALSTRRILELDSRNTSTPVRYNAIESPWQATSGYSTYAYNKGGAVLRMLRQILGQSTFQKSLQNYLNNNSFGNAVTDDLWQEMTDQAQRDNVRDTDGSPLLIKNKLDPWVDQRGYPLVTFTRTGASSVDVTQSQFLNPKDQPTDPSPFLYEWHVPITMANQQARDWTPTTVEWLNRDNKTISVGLPPSTSEWFVANIDQNGFYRTAYDPLTYQQITDQLELDASVIPKNTRFAILNDASQFHEAGLEPAVFAMEATRFLHQEDNYVVWSAAEIHFSYPNLVLARFSSTYTEFVAYLLSKLDPTYTRSSWVDDPTDNNLRKRARALVLAMTCYFGNINCETEAGNQFSQYQASPATNSIQVDHRYTVYCTAVRTGSVSEWDFLHSEYQVIADSIHRKVPAEVSRQLEALACTEDDSLLQRYINYTFDPLLVRSSDVGDTVYAISTSNRGRWVMWSHLKANWNNNPLPAGANKHNTFLTVVEGFASDADIVELEDFILLNPPLTGEDTNAYDDARAIANANNVWANANEADLNAWFTSNK